MANQSRPAPHDAQRPRHTLSLATWRGRDCELAAGEHCENSHENDETQRWGAAIVASRNAWDIGHRLVGRLLNDRRINRDDAERQLKLALAALAAEGGD